MLDLKNKTIGAQAFVYSLPLPSTGCGRIERTTMHSVGLDTLQTSCYCFFPYRHPCARRLGSEQEPAKRFEVGPYEAGFAGGPRVWDRPDARKTLPPRQTKPSLIACFFSFPAGEQVLGGSHRTTNHAIRGAKGTPCLSCEKSKS